MKAIFLVILMTAGFLYGCGETKDTTETKVTEEQSKIVEQPGNTPTNEISTKEKSGEDGTKEVAEKDADIKLKVKDSKLQSASFTAPSMHCTGCEQSITGNLKKLDGVQDVKASFDTKQIEVTYSEDKLTKKDIANAIEESGFECKIND